MSYFSFLGWFVVIPLLLIVGLHFVARRRGHAIPAALKSWPVIPVILAHVLVAILYTTPWDNYLVATNVWWYDPALVTGLLLGWVPIEEYTFFVVQTLLTSSWLLLLARYLTPAMGALSKRARALRFGSAAIVGVLWLGSVVLLFSGWQPGTYLALEVAWALPPIIFQLAFGADILWHHRRLVGWSLLVPTIYLAATDMIAIGAGTWTIDPQQSTGLLIGNLPIEELIFFLLTNTLVVFGVTLVLARESQPRTPAALQRWLTRMSSAAHNGQTVHTAEKSRG